MLDNIMTLKSGLGSLKITVNCIIRWYSFLFTFHSNYGHIKYHFCRAMLCIRAAYATLH